MAGLVLGTIGGMIGGPIGFMIGSAIGNMLTPGPKQEGPRLQSLKLQSSEYGQMIPIPYGLVRLAGNVIWATDLVEHSHTSGGKGGPQVTTYTYTASFASLVCAGPINRILRIWADGAIIYDSTGQTADLDSIPITIYTGTESQLADPTMESVLGAGNVPANRGYCYCVFTDWDLGKFGNRLPSLNFEVCTKGGAIPWQVCTIAGGAPAVTGTTYRGGVLYIGHYSSATYHEDSYQLDGTHLGTIDAPMENLPVNGSTPVVPSAGGGGLPSVCASHSGTFTGDDCAWYASESAAFGFSPETETSGASTFFVTYGITSMQQGEWMYSVEGRLVAGNTLDRWPATDKGVVTGMYDKSYALPDANESSVWLGSSDTGNIYLMNHGASEPTEVKLVELSSDLTELRRWTVADLPVMTGVNGYFVVYNGMIAWTAASALTSQHVDVYTLATLGPTSTPIGTISIGGTTAQGITRFSDGLCVVGNGVISLDPPAEPIALSDIVGDLSTRAGLSGGEYDVTALTDSVIGYTVDRQMDCRSAVLPLQTAYFFDATERAGVMTFVKRGGAAALTIPDKDLGATQPGNTPPLLTLKRMTELDLPATVSVNYTDAETDYQTGTQYARRLVTFSQAASKVDLPIVMTADQAARVAWALLMSSWVEREAPITISLPRKYWHLEPTDVVVAHGLRLRLKAKRDNREGTVEFDAAPDLATVWRQAPISVKGTGFTPSTGTAAQVTALQLLDVPIIADTDAEDGYYAAMGPASTGTWRGAQLYRSIDGGGTYAPVVAASTATVTGTAATALAPFGGGNVFDESNRVNVTVSVAGESLASATEAAVLNGANMALIGDELVQFKTATVVDATTFTLSGLLRGRRGTEWAMSSHVVGERFVLFPVTDVDQDLTELGQERLYKAVTVGSTLAAAAAVPFTSRGAGVRPYAPVEVRGGPVTPFDGTVQINWTRRTRKGGAWVDFVDAQLAEAAEGYVVQVWDSTFTTCARVIETTAPTTTYTAAQQTADFGATQQHVYVTVGQKGGYTLGVQTSAVIAGSGASDGSPIAPVSPYNAAPPPIAGGCTLPVTSDTFTGWPAAEQKFNSAAGPDGTWVLSFTTGASVIAGAGRIDAAEFGGTPVQRHMVLSTSPCGAPLNAGAEARAGTVSIIFYMTGNPYPTMYPTLLPSTTYYISIDSIAASGMLCVLTPP